MSHAPEQRPRDFVATERECRWLEENRDAIASINAFLDRHGLIASRQRYRAQREPA
jgi:post-segregation antitoxin (ccd killing protein)